MSTTAPSRPGPPRRRRAREPLGARAVRVRNAVARLAAARLGLREPADKELDALPADASLGDALLRLERAGAVRTSARAPARLRTAWVSALTTLLGLMLTCGRVQ